MSNPKKPGTGQLAPIQKLHAAAKKTAAQVAKAAKGKNPIVAIIVLAAVALAAILATTVSKGTLAMLYIFANNGKLSGRADGNVYMRNGRARGFVVPSLVQNSYTQLQRVQLGLLSSGWSALTEAEQLSWINLSGLFRSNRFGVPKEVKGKSAYVLINMNLFNAGQALITTAPLLSEVASITDVVPTATVAGQLLSLAYSPSPTGAGITHLVYATAPQRAGIYRPSNSAYRLIDVIAGGSATPYAAGAAYTAKFGAFIAGQKIFVKLVGINNTTGQASPAALGSDVAA